MLTKQALLVKVLSYYILKLACVVDRSDLGVHIDGFIATEATTVVVQSDAGEAITGRTADVVTGAATALEAALRLIRPGRKISDVAEPLQKVPRPCCLGPCPLKAAGFDTYSIVLNTMATCRQDTEAKLRLLRPGRKISDVAKPLQQLQYASIIQL